MSEQQVATTMSSQEARSRAAARLPFEPHRTRLPTFFYLFSFCPAVPSPIQSPRAFFRHPGVLYAIGFVAALLAGCGMPSLDLLYGIYTNRRLRHTYVASVLAQDASHFDLHGAGEIANRASKDISVIRAGFGEKLAYFSWSGATLVVSAIIGFIKAPRIAGVLFALLPLTVIIFSVLGKATEIVGAPALRIEGRSSTFLEQVLGSVRVVQSFGMESQLLKRFDKVMLKPLEKLGMRKSAIRGLETSAVYFMLNLTYSLAFWWGAINIAEGKVLIGDLLTTFWNYLNSLFSLANIVPHIAGIFDAWTALKQVRRAIEREPKIDIRDEAGLSQGGIHPLPTWQGYRLVGPSGSGKSTITSLLLREYDPETANIPHPHDAEDADAAKDDQAADTTAEEGKDPKKAKKSSLFSSKKSVKDSPTSEDIEKSDPSADAGKGGFRAQERFSSPAKMFASSTLAGFDLRSPSSSNTRNFSPPLSLKMSPQALPIIREKVASALQKAEAWHFVSKLPQGMDTPISGGRTGLLSGGQRQRVAIARALVREPRLLCLDEGTSALDSDTESKIKLALQREQEERGMTTILIAHRLSTIEHADSIVVLKNGRVIEEGNHDSLMQKKSAGEGGLYRSMVMQQRHLAEYEAENQDSESNLKDGNKNAAVDAKPHSDATSDSSSDDGIEQGDKLEDQELARSMYALSDDTRTRVDGASTTRSASVVPDEPLSSSAFRPIPLSRHRSSRASDNPYRSFSGRTGTALGQHEHAQEATTGARDADLALPTNTAAAVPIKAEPHDSKSLASSDVTDQRSKAVRKEEKRRLRKTFWRYLNDQKFWFSIGLLGAVTTGTSFPLPSETNRWALWFLTLALVDLVIVMIGSFFLETASEHVMRKLKKEGFSSLIRQEIGFFDAEEHASGAMSAAVSSHPANVAAATGLVLAQVTSVVCLAPILVLFISGWLNISMLEKYEAVAQKPADRAASYVSENVDAIKTVAALGREAETMRVFDERARADPRRTRYLIFGAGGFAVSQAMVLLLSALVFYWGGTLLSRNEVDITALYASFEAVIIAAFSAGRLFTFVPDYGRATNSFKTISGWINRKPLVADTSGMPELDGRSRAKVQDGSYALGDIVLDNIELRYPQRPNHPALKELSITIPPARVLLSAGSIEFGGVDVRQVPIDTLRQQMAYEELEKACEDAYILDFVRGLPNGFDTEIGFKARSYPGILLLDEATSALDAESEIQVQRALDHAALNRTTVTIAHRLSSLRKCDLIFVVEDGGIRESGSHAELIAKGGRYAS
ncbi:related to multidrug resistance protein 1 [Ustilago trichophora]|uniref:Related to multidrug resistance protein 1 n=1 Tax=Ustilago trichophora TaxID=86804 RepID=A0A5C3E6V0_9BASI|nr:related to multidrug resistance protein 1 [Ustilago trichophora]